MQSTLKSEVIGEIERFVNFDEGMVQALLDQRRAGKQLALITNSDWVYTNTMMHATYEPFLPTGMRWADLFDLVAAVRWHESEGQSETLRQATNAEPSESQARMTPITHAGGGQHRVRREKFDQNQDLQSVGDEPCAQPPA